MRYTSETAADLYIAAGLVVPQIGNVHVLA